MPGEALYRVHPADVSIRSTAGDGRTLEGLLVPFHAPTQVSERGATFTEEFLPGSFERTIAERGAERVKLLMSHDLRTLPVGRAVRLEERARGLYGALRVSQTGHGDEVLELVRDGALDGLSIGFVPIRDHWHRQVRQYLEVKLLEVSLTPMPAYDDARVLAVRAHDRTPATPTVPPVAILRRRLDLAMRAPQGGAR